jgi:hypothetical protein
MSDNYHYEDGAKHYDHKKVLHIESVGSGDIEKLISAFFKDGAEEAEVLEELEDESTNSERRDTLPLENRVLKKNHNGKRIDFQALHKMLRESFVDEIKYNYEWLAPWRILDDLSLLEDTTLTAFAEQMNKWYPDAKKPCNADSMGDYFNPYLGSTAFVLWDENEFKKRKTSKQSINGYRLLYNDCEAIKEALKSFFKQ